MGGLLPVTLVDVHMSSMKTDVVVPKRPIFFKRYVENICNRRQENPYCLKNENSSKQFIKSFDEFTDDNFDMQIKCLTKRVKNLFKS